MFKFYKTYLFYLVGVSAILPFFAIAEKYTKYYFPIGNKFKMKTLPNQELTASLKNDEVDLSSFLTFMDEQLKHTDYADDLQAMEDVIESFSPPDGVAFQSLCEQTSSKNLCMKKVKNTLTKAFDKLVQEKQNQILYPEDYSSIYDPYSKEDRDINQRASDNLDSKCEASSILAIGTLRLHPKNWPKLQKDLKKKNKKFLTQLVKKIYNELEKEQYPKQCLKKVNGEHKVCKQMNKELAVKVQRVKYILKLIYGEDVEATEAGMACLDCVKGSGAKQLKDLKNLIPLLKENLLCFGPAPGETKQVIKEGFFSTHYTVVREQDGSFTIPLDLKFAADKNYKGDIIDHEENIIPKDKVPDHYKKIVQKCLKKANTKMLGPEGEKFQIVIEELPDKKDDFCQKTTEIKITSKDHRSNNLKYESNISCPLIIHEVLHLLGLCDEYKERTKGFYVSDDGSILDPDKPENRKNSKFVPAYDCRITISNSMMSYESKRWDKVFKENTESSLLNPGQFNAILYGDCVSKNKLFNDCTNLSYKSSIKQEHKDCLKQKVKCMKSNFMGLDKNKEFKKISEKMNFIKQEILRRQETIKQLKAKNSPQQKIAPYQHNLKLDFTELEELKEELEMVKAWP